MAAQPETRSMDAKRPLLVVCARTGTKLPSGKTLPGSKVITAAKKLPDVELILAPSDVGATIDLCDQAHAAGRKVVVVLDCERRGGVIVAQALAARGIQVFGLVSSAKGEAARFAIKLEGRDSTPVQIRWSKQARTRGGAPVCYPGTRDIIVQECTIPETVEILKGLLTQ